MALVIVIVWNYYCYLEFLSCRDAPSEITLLMFRRREKNLRKEKIHVSRNYIFVFVTFSVTLSLDMSDAQYRVGQTKEAAFANVGETELLGTRIIPLNRLLTKWQ